MRRGHLYAATGTATGCWSRVSPEWQPSISKMMLYDEGARLCVRVDPPHADAWRREPYYSRLKECSRKALESQQQVVVYIRKRTIVILPDKDVDLGDLEVGDQIWFGRRRSP